MGKISGDWCPRARRADTAGAGREEKNLPGMQGFEARVHITLDMIEVGSHGSFLSKGMAAGKGLGWDGLREERYRRVIL